MKPITPGAFAAAPQSHTDWGATGTHRDLRLWARALLAINVVVVAACSTGEPRPQAEPCKTTVAAIRACVKRSAAPIRPTYALPGQHPPEEVRLYVDRSGSMAGYLDRSFGVAMGVSNLKTLLSELLAVRGAGTKVYGFGNGLVPLKLAPGMDPIQRLVTQGFYSDNDTRTEDVLNVVAADNDRTAVHLIVTDGRRGGSGSAAIAQYKRLGEVARAWVGNATNMEGVFAIGASLVPFRPPADDAAGCSSPGGSRRVGRCALYVFAFVPRAVAEPFLAALRTSMQHVYVYPAVSDSAITYDAEPERPIPAGATLRVFHAPLVLAFHTEGAASKLDSLPVRVRMEATGSAARFSLDDSLVVQMERSPLTTGEPHWQPVTDLSKEWVAPESPQTGANSALVMAAQLRSRPGLSPSIYRLGIVSSGLPRWLRDYEAPAEDDSVRTYALSTLFLHLAPRAARIGGFYVSVY